MPLRDSSSEAISTCAVDEALRIMLIARSVLPTPPFPYTSTSSSERPWISSCSGAGPMGMRSRSLSKILAGFSRSRAQVVAYAFGILLAMRFLLLVAFLPT